MRAHAARIGSVANHQIVQTRVGGEAKLVHQSVNAIVQQIYALHQYRPARLFQRRQSAARKRAVVQRPRLRAIGIGVGLHDEARFHIVPRG